MDSSRKSVTPVPISGLQHWVYCERQAALIHLERQWAENVWTADGRLIHRRAHEGASETRHGTRIVRGLPLLSRLHGLVGVADVVEFRGPGHIPPSVLTELLSARIRGDSVSLEGWECRPIEYKRGRPKKHRSDEVQLAAQALCLEEMLGVPIKTGRLYYAAVKRRSEVVFDAALRALVAEATLGLRRILESGKTPAARHDRRCAHCSLAGVCLPQAKPSATQWFLTRLEGALSSGS